MSLPTVVAAPNRHRRWLVIAAVIAAGATATILAITLSAGSREQAGSVVSPMAPAGHGPSATSAIMSLTPARLAGGALGSGYALPSAQPGPSLDSVLGSMSPQTRRYTKAIMSLTFAQLAAGAAGSP